MKKLILLPNILHEESTWHYTPPPVHALIAESKKGGYQFLSRFHLSKCPLYLLNEHTQHPQELLKISEEIVGLITDAGLACLADPGSQLVAAAHASGIPVDTIPGPSSLIMALQLSGFSGQAFTFHGYLPRDENHLFTFLKKLSPAYTHLFIETPYRTKKVFQLLLKFLPSHAHLCLAVELMGPKAYVQTQMISDWKKKLISLSKNRAVFLIRLG